MCVFGGGGGLRGGWLHKKKRKTVNPMAHCGEKTVPKLIGPFYNCKEFIAVNLMDLVANLAR